VQPFDAVDRIVPGRRTQVLVAVALTVSSHAMGLAQGRTDVVSLPNGDRITGEVVRLDRGILEFKTDEAGTIYLEWIKLSTLVATRQVEVVTTDGSTFLGTLGPAAARSIAVIGPQATVPLQMSDVTLITPIGRSFWRKLDGSMDAGFSYTRSSAISQLNLNLNSVYRQPKAESRVTAALTQTHTEDEGGIDARGAVEMSYRRFTWPRWSITALGRFESNESLGLTLRSLGGAAIGPRLVNSNRAQLTLGGGLTVSYEQGVDVAPTTNLDALLFFQHSFYTYDHPSTNLNISVQYFPSLSDLGRQRLQLDANVRREIWKDFFVSLNLYDTHDTRPPNPEADRYDIGVVASVGWSY
jgi:hypothetical protein